MRTDTPEHPAHDHLHGSHPAIINRLKRANGHLNRVIQMLEQNRHCNDIARAISFKRGIKRSSVMDNSPSKPLPSV
ncbi:metal-sensing transcriptional repressor [Testudinibacter sp. TR-2022]|uniref:metal-sensing transcriptional repressor n=1 Tax=Testudinibacter sp. TR-2022 TaxID=2585029 RepID=UPI00111ABDE2|nr:metal-sensing transcriptional repressor [Testudinibacter sp. TR-2022]TNH24143.1 metal-sensing transcriptional repressor [Testudinibacter sp. TR-2022]